MNPIDLDEVASETHRSPCSMTYYVLSLGPVGRSMNICHNVVTTTMREATLSQNDMKIGRIDKLEARLECVLI